MNDEPAADEREIDAGDRCEFLNFDRHHICRRCLVPLETGEPVGLLRCCPAQPLAVPRWRGQVCTRSNSSDEVAIVTSHFNPFGFCSPVQNYWEWRRHLGPLVSKLTTVELTFDRASELRSSLIVQGGPQHILWQKEALLNLALRQLPSSIKFVALLDHDLIFEDVQWLDNALLLMRTGKTAVQLFDRVVFLAKHGAVESFVPGAVWNWLIRRRRRGAPGGGWMVRRDYLENIRGLCTNNIVGGGDRIACAAWLNLVPRNLDRMARALVASNMRWHAAARIPPHEVGYLSGAVLHLFHGSARQYDSRQQILVDHEFDPLSDLAMEESGILRISGKDGLRRDIEEYFRRRAEDD